MLFLIGLFLNGFPLFDLTVIRIPGVLQRLALVYFVTGLIYLALYKIIINSYWKKLSIIISLAFSVGCFYQWCFVNNVPEVKLDVSLTGISDAEFQQVGNSLKTSDLTSNDFRKLNISAQIIHSKSATERKIEIPQLQTIINSYDKVRGFSGGSFEQNNIGQEDFAEYGQSVVFNASGLTESKIREIFDQAFVIFTWKTPEGKKVEQSYSIGQKMVVNEAK